jgi:type IV secretion system protein VirD4
VGFALTAEIWGKNGGIYLGYAVANTEGPPEDMQPRPLQIVTDRHLMTWGPNGSGKSRRALLPNLVNLTDWSMLVIDIKGELASWSAEHRKTAGSEVIYLNPFGVGGLPSTGFNPVAALDPTSDDFVDDALGLAEAIIREEGNEPHWSASAQDLICALIMYSRLTGPNDGSLGHVRALLGQPSLGFVEVVKAMMATGEKLGQEELTVKAARFRDLTPESRELHSILSTALTQTRWLDSRPIKKDLARGTFDFSSMKQRPVTVYLILPANRLGTHSSWLRLIITALVQKLIKDLRSSTPVLLMLDEAAQLSNPPIIRNSMPILRSFGVKLWSVYQDLPLTQLVLGEAWESFIANCGVLQSFAPQDMRTANFLSERSGERNADVLSYSSAAARGSQTGGQLSFKQDKLPGILPQRLINMDEGYSILFTHKTKGTVRSYLPDPSTMAGFEQITGPGLTGKRS